MCGQDGVQSARVSLTSARTALSGKAAISTCWGHQSRWSGASPPEGAHVMLQAEPVGIKAVAARGGG